MTKPAGTTDLIASFPAAGSGGTTLEQLEKLAARRGMAYVAMSNPASTDSLESGEWQAESIEEIRRAVDQASAGRVILVGHCMGGLSAVRLSEGVASGLALPVRVLGINTPCPDSTGRIPTMSQFSDAEVAEVLAHDGFPQDLLDDEDMLAEIADGLRKDATVADRLAEWVNSAGDLETLHVLSTRGDVFIPPEQCAPWRHRVSGEFQLTITKGGHSLDEALIGVLERAIDSVRASARAEVA
ncbi:thioesterase II family protein [Streptomyces sp.]|uniref:thioesterase II family protein n=1 Tax=Streptomyces sp. TaxID=1931 RepID=UPI002F3EC5B6